MKERGQKDANKPKKPPNPFMSFCSARREEARKVLLAGHKNTDVTRKLSEMWKAAPPAEKSKFEKEFKKNTEAYKAAIEEYKKSRPADEIADSKDEEEEDEEEEEEEEEDEEDRDEDEEDAKTVPVKKRPAAAGASVPKKRARTAGA